MTDPAVAAWAEQPLRVLPGIGPKREAALASEMGLRQLGDLLRVLPRRYEAPAVWVTSASWPEQGRVRVQAEVEKTSLFRPRGRPPILSVRFRDDDGTFEALIFSQPWLKDRFPAGRLCRLEGTASTARGKQLMAPRMLRDDEAHDEVGLRPHYPEGAGLSAGQMAKLVQSALESLQAHCGSLGLAAEDWVPEPIPQSILDGLGLPRLGEAWLRLHQPACGETVERCRRRLAFGEVVRLERARLQQLPAAESARPIAEEVWQRILARIPFALTPDQQQVLTTLRGDLESGQVMRRLLHGEVGSGKTVIAFALALAMAAQGRQAAILAPTEILARQHLTTFRRWLADSRVQIVRLLGDDSIAERRASLAALAQGRAAIAIGTHALFGPQVRFADLGLVALDEQHRFGVRQKAALVAKGRNPHVLTMTATPIPRTLAWASYGALEPCVLHGRPGSGGEVVTVVYPESAWAERSAVLAQAAAAGAQTFLVAPRIDGEQGLRALAASLRAGAWADLQLAVVHGRMPGAEIEARVRAFARGELHALLGTTVVEVGLDVPDVPQMAVLGAERLGLASLHQLRGRLARGAEARPARCEVFAPESAQERLKPLEEHTDGFAIARVDLQQRGPGLLRGLAQSGHGGFQRFDPRRDEDLVAALRREEIRNWLADPG